MAKPTTDRDRLPPLQGLIPRTVTVEAFDRGVPEDTWDPVDMARDPRDCMPGLTLCSEPKCMEGWLIDYFLRVLDKGVVVWVSPDAPRAARTPPSGGAVVIPFPHR